MAHHWSDQFENQMSGEEFKKLFSKDESQPGATGKFPDGKIDALDEGEIRIRIGVKDKRIIMEFGKPVASIGFTKDEAFAIGEQIIEIALKV